MSETILFNSRHLLPDAWCLLADGPVWGFNPALCRTSDGFLFAYRIVTTDDERRIGICRLDKELSIIPGSLLAVSDEIFRSNTACVRNWFADPRLYTFQSRIFLYWNSGWHSPQNEQYLQELDARTLAPIGPARLLMLEGKRRQIEKNWTFFGEGPFYAVYSIVPHRVLEFSLDGSGPIQFREVASVDWNPGSYVSEFGELRGGCPPIREGNTYLSIVHSLLPSANGAHYLPAVYRFNAKHPFAPLTAPLAPLPLPEPFQMDRIHGRLNPAAERIVYPCGATVSGESVLISYGINDELCAIARLHHNKLESSMCSLVAEGEKMGLRLL